MLAALPLMLLCTAGILPQAAYAAKGPATAAGPGEPGVFAFLAWDADAGRILGDQSDSEGPKSFAVRADGGVLILDQVNLRILDFDTGGRQLGAFALPGPTFDDVGEAGGRFVLALDRLVTRTLLVFDADGTIVSELDLVGHGVEHAGLITAMIPRSDGVWLEVSHRHSVRVLDAAMQPCQRRIILGRPIEGGRSLIGALDGAGGVDLSVGARNGKNPDATAKLSGVLPVRRIVALDADARGRTLAVLHEAAFSGVSPYRVTRERYRLARLDADLRVIGDDFSPWVLTELDQRVEFRLGPDGAAWQMFFTWEGVYLVRLEGRTP